MPLKFSNFSLESKFESDFDSADHPARLVERIASSIDDKSHFELSYYKYFPQSLLDERRKVKVPKKEFHADKVGELLSGLMPDEELAFHSVVEVGVRKKFHFPLIDFHGRLDSDALDLIEKTLGSRVFENLVLYDSGRSFHGYVMRPHSEKEWVRFMGNLLLMNLPDKPPISDSRWIGHRLRAGYASLRWSKNTKHYKLLPTRVSFEGLRGGV